MPPFRLDDDVLQPLLVVRELNALCLHVGGVNRSGSEFTAYIYFCVCVPGARYAQANRLEAVSMAILSFSQAVESTGQLLVLGTLCLRESRQDTLNPRPLTLNP